MRNFFKEHSYNIVKLFLNQIGITVFGTMLALATSGNSTLLLASSIFSVLFFLSLNYNACWEIGAKDKIRIDGGRLKPMPGKGAILSLAANSVNLFLSLLMGAGVLIGTAASEGMSVICNAVARLLNGMYLGLIKMFEFIIYTAPRLKDAAAIMGEHAASSAEVRSALELIEGAAAGSSIEPIGEAMKMLESAASSVPEITEAYSLLEAAYYSPGIADIWWWFALITVPAIVVGWVSYLLGSKNIRLFSAFSKKNGGGA